MDKHSPLSEEWSISEFPRHVAFVASEAAPFVKTGGLGDVVGALPRALHGRGVRVTTIIPRFLATKHFPQEPLGTHLTVPAGKKSYRVELFSAADPLSGHQVLLVGQPDLYEREGLYVDESGQDYPDNLVRFHVFSRAALLALETLGAAVDIVHANDWQTGLVPLYLRELRSPALSSAASLFTIHNIIFQGNFPVDAGHAIGLSAANSSERELGYHQQISLLKGGILVSDIVTTVSKQYARELQTPELGCGMEGYLKARGERFRGIVNGIDTNDFDPKSDRALVQAYDPLSWRKGKEVNKAALLSESMENSHKPLIGMVTRLTEQKGLDLLRESEAEIFDGRAHWIILGTGDREYEEWLAVLAKRRPECLTFHCRFDEKLARQIYAGSDMFLMPSRFEPCGLAQLYALRYGSVPIVHAVGGLKDTIVPADTSSLAAGTATGFAFDHYSPEALVTALHQAVALFQRPEDWNRLVERGMAADWSWESAASQYLLAYREALRWRQLPHESP